MTKKCYVIAEAGVNHNGSLQMAKELIEAAAAAGADAVKFQTFKTEQIVSKSAEKAKYQQETTSGGKSQYEMLKALELSETMHLELADYCQQQGVDFLSTPFDLPSLDFLVKQLNMQKVKIPSGEITNVPFLHEIGLRGLPVFLSTGMSTVGDIELALGALALGYMGETEHLSADRLSIAAYGEGRVFLERNVTLLHCTTEYPAPLEDVHLHAMTAMRQTFGLPAGYSDHTEGIAVSVAAAALGATVIEKHFTLDRSLPGPDHRASLEPDELQALVSAVRQVEQALGTPIKAPSSQELDNRSAVRKSLVATTAIQKGEPFTHKNLGVKRPGHGISPVFYWDKLGKLADRDYEQDELIQ